jgi:hypothetical protein
MDYDFSTLSDHDLELLSADLLGRKFDVTLEVFARGPDEGIDLRHIASDGSLLVVQCKHWARSGWNKLRSNLKGEELSKVRKINPRRYVVVTSVPMTPPRKREIYGIFEQFMESENDVYGPDDLNTLLRAAPDIEENHFKLWLTSSVVLQRIVGGSNRAITEFHLEEVRRKASLYVPGTAFDSAMEILDTHHTCVISGSPGVGKSMLADMLLYRHAGEGYEPVVVEQDVSEATRQFKADTPQVFLYDDFLGQTASAEKLAKKEDARLVALIDRVGRSGNKRFILTTREYILRQAQFDHERIRQEPRLEASTFTLQLAQYSRFERAQILYNHLFFSDLPKSRQLEILDDRGYVDLVDHRNYNPRLREYAIRCEELQTGERPLAASLLDVFDNPESLWAHAFENQLDDLERAILITLCSLPTTIPLDSLLPAVEAYADQGGLPTSRLALQRSLKVLEDSFLSLDPHSEHPALAFENPSIRDYMLNHVESNPDLVSRLVRSSIYFEQVELLHDYSRGSRWNRRTETQFDGLRQWFAVNAIMVVEALKALFESAPGAYQTYQISKNSTSLRPYRRLERRIVSLRRIAENLDIGLGDWTSQALETVAQQWDLGRGDRSAWAALLSGADSADRDQFQRVRERAREWFFGDLDSDGESFDAYLRIEADASWWLEDRDAEHVRRIFADYAYGTLDWASSSVDDEHDAVYFLDQVKAQADALGVSLDQAVVEAVEEAIYMQFGPEDEPEWDYRGSTSGEHSGHKDIDSLFRSL